MPDRVVSYIEDETHDADLWQMKHQELIWMFTRYYTAEELHSFFCPMTDEQVPFNSLVLTYEKHCRERKQRNKADRYFWGIISQ